jgi:hypothetical protein
VVQIVRILNPDVSDNGLNGWNNLNYLNRERSDQLKELVMAKPQTKKTLEMFNQELAEVHMTGQWIYEDLLNRAIGGPRPRGDAYLWPWAMVHEKLLEACDGSKEVSRRGAACCSVIPARTTTRPRTRS